MTTKQLTKKKKRVRLIYPDGSNMQYESAFWVANYDLIPYAVEGSPTTIEIPVDNDNKGEQIFSGASLEYIRSMEIKVEMLEA